MHKTMKTKPNNCNHIGDKTNFHPQYCKKCGKEFMYDILTKPNNSWEIKFNKEFRHWFEDYLNENLDEDCKERLKDFITKTLQQQREIWFDESCNKAETEAEISSKAYDQGYLDCKKGRKKAPHDIRDGYCCACDYDLACFKEKLEQQREEIIKEIEGIVREDEKLKYGRAGAVGKTIRECELFHYGEKAGRNQLRKEIRERLKQIIN